jgi:hypothetical protein
MCNSTEMSEIFDQTLGTPFGNSFPNEPPECCRIEKNPYTDENQWCFGDDSVLLQVWWPYCQNGYWCVGYVNFTTKKGYPDTSYVFEKEDDANAFWQTQLSYIKLFNCM